MSDAFESFKVDGNMQDQEVHGKVAELDFSKVSDESLFGFLTGRVGRDIKSWDDLVIEKEVEKVVPASFANEEIENIDRYVKETGRSVSDYMSLHKDWSKVSDDAIVEEYLRMEYPDYTDEEIKELAELNFGTASVNEDDMDEKEISSIQKENRKKEFAKKSYVSKARRFFEESKEKYKQPAARQADVLKEGAEAWRNSMKKAVDDLNVVEIGDFKYELGNREKYSSICDLQRMIDSFKENGVMNYNKLAKTLIVGMEAENILNEHRNFTESSIREAIMKEYSNKDGVLQRTLGDSVEGEELMKRNIKILKES